MNWYSVKLIFQIRTGEVIESIQFDESVRLFQAATEQEALTLARHAGIQDEVSFTNIYGERVLWKFIDVIQIHRIEKLQSGVEIYSDTRIEERPSRFIRNIRIIAGLMKKKDTSVKIISVE